MKLKTGILGATGYTGAELLRLLVNHTGVEICWLTSEKFTGMSISEVFPHLRSYLDIQCRSVRSLNELREVDLVFSCLPGGTSAHFVRKMLDSGARVIDFSSDFRFSDDAVYGLPEINSDQIINAPLVANPGCYATSVILGLAPLAAEGLLKGSVITADIITGLSGGGRAPSLEHHFSEVNESAYADSAAGGDQKEEMEQRLSNLSERGEIEITFMTHRVPIDRGILATIYCNLKNSLPLDRARRIYEEFYGEKKFIRVLDAGNYPSTKNVRYSNICDIGLGIQDDVFISVVALDNLGKGAAGQAVQNMNLMFDFPETTGLEMPTIYP